MSDKEVMWALVKEGILLREEGIKAKSYEDWRMKCLDWEKRMIAAAHDLSSDLGHLVSPLGDLDPVDSAERVAHQKDVTAMSTVLRILRREIPKIEGA